MIESAGIISCDHKKLIFINSNYRKLIFAVKSEKRRPFRKALRPCN